jgi:hypothetical protein
MRGSFTLYYIQAAGYCFERSAESGGAMRENAAESGSATCRARKKICKKRFFLPVLFGYE